jgi:hypothetical protein
MSGFSPSPWIPLTNHTPKRGSFYSANSEREEEDLLRSVPLTRRDGRTLRDDCLIAGGGAVTPVEVGWAVDRFEQYVDDKADLWTVLQDMNDADERKVYIENSHRFETDYMTEQMGKFYALERQAVERWGSDGLTMVMLTLSASPFDEGGELLPPVDHLDSIMDANHGSWRAVRTALGRAVGDRDWEYARILEPHTPHKGMYASSGYCHVHVGLFVNDPAGTLQASDFSGVLSSHVNNCETARESAHEITDGTDSSVTLTRYDEDRDGGMGAYLTAYLGEQLEETVDDAPDFMKRYMAVLWASGRRRVSFSNGAQEWIREDYEERKSEEERVAEAVADGMELLFDESDWKMVGIETVNEDGEREFIACENDGGGSYMGRVALPVLSGQSKVADTEAPPDRWTLENIPGAYE